MANEMSEPTGRAPTTVTGDPDRSIVAAGAIAGAAGAAVGALAEVVDEEGGTNGQRTLSVPGSRGTGPVDPANDFVDNTRG